MKPCEYCGADLPSPEGKRSRQIRGAHFASCPMRPTLPIRHDEPPPDPLRVALEAIIKNARANGRTEITVDDIECGFGEL